MFSYYTTIIFFAVFVMLIMTFLIGCNDLLEKSQKKFFYSIATLVIVASIAEWLGAYLDGSSDGTRVLHIIVKVIELCLAPILPIMCVAVLKGYKYIRHIIPVIIAHTLLEILSGIWGFIFYIDKSNIYCHGTFYWIYMLAYISGTLLFIFNAFKISEKYYGLNKLVLWSILFFVVSGISIQTINNKIRVDWLCISIDVLIFYIFYSELMQKSDAVTSLLNRRSYDSRLSRINSPAVILFIDVDDFKSINDSYGHAFGDSCLNIIGLILHQTYERVGRCYRIGGDEFCAILNISCDEVDDYNSTLLYLLDIQRLKESRIPYISIGYTFFEPDKESIEDAIKRADAMMYKYKNTNKSVREI